MAQRKLCPLSGSICTEGFEIEYRQTVQPLDGRHVEESFGELAVRYLGVVLGGSQGETLEGFYHGG
jgi:hypothetical protein